MIVQITMVRNEKFLLEKLLPVWTKYADGFVFLVDTSNDGTEEFLREAAKQYNILDIIVQEADDNTLWVASEVRQKMFDKAKQYTNKIVCLDADEYFDGSMTKEELENILDSHQDTLFDLRWVQYTSANTIRVDGPWKNNTKGRIGVFNKDYTFRYDTMHATHLPIPQNQYMFPEESLFIAHLQWLDRNIVGIKQYCYKVQDYASHIKFGANVVEKEAYDASINDFNWEEEYYDYPLKIQEDIYEHMVNGEYYRTNIVKQYTKELNIPNLGDWGLNIHDSVQMYFHVSCDSKNYNLLLNLIGSLHRYNYYDIGEISITDLGLTNSQRRELANIKKVVVNNSESCTPEYPYALRLSLNSVAVAPLNKLFTNQIEVTKRVVEYKELEEFAEGMLSSVFELEYSSYKLNTSSLKRRMTVSCITAIGDLDKYERFIDSYFHNIQSQINFLRTEFVIVYKEWSSKFEEYQSYDNIIFIPDTDNRGMYHAWNIGLQNCVAEFVTSWNIDDLRYPLNLKIKLDTLTRDINIDLAYNHYVAMTTEEIEADVDPSSKSCIAYPDNFHEHVKAACMTGPDPLWRKSYHAFGGYFDTDQFTIIGDWEMWMRMASHGLKMRLVPYVLCIYGEHDSTVSKSSSVKLEEQKITLANLYSKINIPIADTTQLCITV